MRWAKVTESVCRLPISNAQFRVLICLMTYADDKTGYCYPSVGEIARERNRTHSTIRHHLNALVELGVITRDARPRKDVSQGANRYCVARLRRFETEAAPVNQPAAAEQPPMRRAEQPALLLPLNGGRRTAARPDDRKTPLPARRARRADLIAATGLAQITGWAK
jgi:hypothetical protein